MRVGIVGLGLIGGSFAKAFKNAGHTVLAKDSKDALIAFGKLSGDIHEVLTESNVAECDLLLICTYPQAALDFLEASAPSFSKDTLVIDCCGVKRGLTPQGFAAAEKYGFTFVGGHPMAGMEFSGFKYASADLFSGASMIIVPPTFDDIELLNRVKTLLKPANFGSITVSTVEKHDRIIAFTSQLSHIISSSYIKSPTALEHKGFSAGSYKDMARIAGMNPEMWSELFLENKDNLLSEIDTLLDNLKDYRNTLAGGSKEELVKLLKVGKVMKEKVDNL